jgi:o-succinylbenzoate---CoA ligase
MTTVSTSPLNLPIRWLNFDRPADILTLPFEALPIAMQSAVRDRQYDILCALQNGTDKNRVDADRIRLARLKRVAILVADPWDCLVSAIAAHTLGCDLFLCDPSWSEAERTDVFAQIHPAVTVHDRILERSSDQRIATSRPIIVEPTLTDPHIPSNTLTPQINRPISYPDRDPYWAIPTGGTSGRIRFACHTWRTLTTSAIGVRNFFQRDRLNSFCCLPVFHVSGLAQCIRAIVSGGQLALTQPATLRPDRTPPDRDLRSFWLSLVPTQLQRLIDRPDWLTWLQQFDVIFLGGAPAWAELLDTARSQGLRLAPTFGMTETASQVATLHPDDFLAGRTGCGRVLPHADLTILTISPNSNFTQSLTQSRMHTSSEPPRNTGSIAIRARSLFHGYYDASLGTANLATAATPWQTDDLGYFDADGFLHIVGRASQKVITGGENVYPEEVEAAVRGTGLVRDVAVVGLPDREWGQCLAAAYVPWPQTVSGDLSQAHDRLVEQLRDRLASKLARYKIPKHWQAIDPLPRNDRGKLDRAALALRFNPVHFCKLQHGD